MSEYIFLCKSFWYLKKIIKVKQSNVFFLKKLKKILGDDVRKK